MPLLLADVGGTKTKSAVWDGNVAEIEVISSGAGLGESLQMVAERFSARGADKLALCVGGIVDSGAGTTQQMDKLVDVYQLLDRVGLPRPLVFVNDTEACAAGEAQGSPLALLQWSTGVGVAVADSKSVRADGADGNPLALGHLALADRSHLCYCGGRGCVSTAAAWTTLRETLRKHGHKADEPHDMLAPAALADGEVKAALDDATRAIARLSAFVAATTQREMRFGGGLALCFREQLETVLAEEWLSLHSPSLHRQLHWSFSTLTDAAGLWGLARLAGEHA